MNPIFEYYEKIKSGDVTVGRKIRILYWYICEILWFNDKYEYRQDLAQYAQDFIENYCRHSKVKGNPLFILELWQRALVHIVFGIVFKGTTIRKHRVVMLIIGRKNGKSTFASAISLYLLIADGEAGPEIYAVATKRDQAKIIWSEAVKMLNKSPVLQKHAKAKVSEIVCYTNEGTYRPLGRDSKTQDGLNPSGATMDEIEAWTDMNMYDVIVDGAISRDNWLVFMTSTAGPVREAVWDDFYKDATDQINAYTEKREVDEAMIYFVYEIDEKEEWKIPEMWYKANPGLGTIKKYDELERKVNAALLNPKKVSNLIMKDFNVPDTSVSSWLNLEDIQLKDTEGNVIRRRFKLKAHYPEDEEALKPLYGIGGVDMSIRTDLTCATVLFKVPYDSHIYVKQMYWIPESVVEDKERSDKVPYRVWEEQGYLRTCQGNQINYLDVYEWFVEVQEHDDIWFHKIGYDGYSFAALKDKLIERFGEDVPVPVYQGVKTLSSPMHSLGAEIKDKNIIYDNPILEWCLTNVEIKQDENENIKPVKPKNRNRRIDGFASLLDAYVVLVNDYDTYMSKI